MKPKFKNKNEMPLTTENLDNFEGCIIVGTATAILIGIFIFFEGCIIVGTATAILIGIFIFLLGVLTAS